MKDLKNTSAGNTADYPPAPEDSGYIGIPSVSATAGDFRRITISTITGYWMGIT